MIDKSGVLARRDLRDVVIELGCGPRKRHAGSIATSSTVSTSMSWATLSTCCTRSPPAARSS